MGVKKGYRLDQIHGLSQEIQDRCREQWITTAEEFVGHAWGAPEEFCEFLGISKEELDRVTETVSRYIDPDFLEKMREFRDNPPQYGMGALDPKDMPQEARDRIREHEYEEE